MESSLFTINILWMVDLPLISFKTSYGIYSIAKESKYTVSDRSIFDFV